MRILVIAPGEDLEGTVRPDADLDGLFTLTTDEGERFRVYGWACEIRILAQPQ